MEPTNMVKELMAGGLIKHNDSLLIYWTRQLGKVLHPAIAEAWAVYHGLIFMKRMIQSLSLDLPITSTSIIVLYSDSKQII